MPMRAFAFSAAPAASRLETEHDEGIHEDSCDIWREPNIMPCSANSSALEKTDIGCLWLSPACWGTDVCGTVGYL